VSRNLGVASRSRSPWGGRTLGVGVLLALSMVVGYLELFRTLDWGYGIWRALLVVCLAAAAYAVLTRTRGQPRPAERPMLLVPTAALALAVNLVAGVQAIRSTLATGEIEMDQGQNSFRAVEYLRKGANPYAQTAMLDPVSWAEALPRWQQQPGCLVASAPSNLLASFSRYWANVDPKATASVLPAISAAPECKPLQTQASSLGYKYGPLLLAAYLPFVVGFGKSGIFVAHIVFVLLTVALLVWHGRRRGSPLPVVAGAVFLALAPSHLRHNVLESSASDLGPVLAATAAVIALMRGRDGWAAFLVGLSVAGKTLPGVLYVPLLLACRPRAWLLFFAPIVATFIPFLVWDSGGFINNIVLFNLGRPTDSTALAHFLPPVGTRMIQAAGLATMVLALLRARKRAWLPQEILAYLWAANAAVLAGGTIFHNNYLLWLLPLLGLTYLSVVDPDRATLGRTDAAGLRPT
jgi:hypothetical protein